MPMTSRKMHKAGRSFSDSQTGSSTAITSTQKIRQLSHHGWIRLRKCLTGVVYGGVDHAFGEVRSERVLALSLWLTSSWQSERESTPVLKWALLCDVSPVQIHSLVANVLLSPRLCEIFQHLAQRSSLSRVGCENSYAIINQSWHVISEEECLSSFHDESEKGRKKSTVLIQLLFWRKNYHLFQMTQLSIVVNCHTAILAKERLRYEPNECLQRPPLSRSEIW